MEFSKPHALRGCLLLPGASYLKVDQSNIGKGVDMASWSEVGNFLEGQGWQLNDGGQSWTGGYKLANGRVQMVLAMKFDAEGDVLDHLILASPFAKTSEVSAEQALSIPSIYGVKNTGDFYVLVDPVPIGEVDESEILVPLNLLAIEADRLEQNFSVHDSF